MEILRKIYEMTAIGEIINTPSSLVMLVLACVLLYLGIFKKYEPLLLVPIGFGVLIANFPGGNMNIVTSDMYPGNQIHVGHSIG